MSALIQWSTNASVRPLAAWQRRSKRPPRLRQHNGLSRWVGRPGAPINIRTERLRPLLPLVLDRSTSKERCATHALSHSAAGWFYLPDKDIANWKQLQQKDQRFNFHRWMKHCSLQPTWILPKQSAHSEPKETFSLWFLVKLYANNTYRKFVWPWFAIWTITKKQSSPCQGKIQR